MVLACLVRLLVCSAILSHQRSLQNQPLSEKIHESQILGIQNNPQSFHLFPCIHLPNNPRQLQSNCQN